VSGQDTGKVTEQAPQHVVATVTGNDLLARLDTYASTLAKIETKVDNIPGDIAALHMQVERHSVELDRLARWRAQWTGALTVLSLLLSSGVAAAIITAVRR